MSNLEQQVVVYSNYGVFESPSNELNIYPYKNLDWLNYVERFKFKVPETIITKADGHSTCTECRQIYAGYQEKCVRLRYGYEISGYHHNVKFGHKMVGEYTGYNDSDLVKKSGLYPCHNYCTWNLSNDFNKQQAAFSELNMVIEKMCGLPTFSNIKLDSNDSEKWMLIQQIDILAMQNDQMRNALKEVVNRLNAGGQGLMGYINF